MVGRNFFLFIGTFIFISSLTAQNWTGAVNGDWNNPANWDTWPLDGEDVTIDPSAYTGAAASPTVGSNSVFSPALVLCVNGGSLIIAANLTTQDDVEVIGLGSALTVTGGSFQVNPANGGRLIIDLGATMLVQGGSTLVGERLIAGEDALITVNNGNVASNERLLMDLGGHIVQNGGIVSTGAVFAMADGSANQNSAYTLNNGSLSVTGEMAFENEFGVYEPTFTQNGGTLTVNGDVFWFGAAPGAGRPRFIQNSGIATVSGTISNMALSTVDLYLQLDGDAQFNFSGSSISLLNATDSIVQRGNAVLNLNTLNTIINPGVFFATGGLTVVNGNTTLTGSGLYQFHHLNINSGKSLQHQSPQLMYMSGDLNKIGSFAHFSNTLVLNGAALQQLNGSGTLVLHSLTLDNTSAGVQVNLPINVQGHLELTAGNLHTNNTNPFQLLDNATVSSGSNASFVNGPMLKTGNDPFVFPIGNNGRWRRIGMSAPASINAQLRATYFSNSHTPISPVNAPLTAVSNIEYWQLDELVEAGSLSVTLHWEDASQSAISDCANLGIGRWNGSSWDHVFGITSGSCTGSDFGSITSVGTIQNFGPLTFGYLSGVTSQNISICSGESYLVGNNVYTSEGVYIDVLQDVNLQDSTVITNLTVNQPDASYAVNGFSLQAVNTQMDNYQWFDCDSNLPVPQGNALTFSPVVDGWYQLHVDLNGCQQASECIYINKLDTAICAGEVLPIGTSNYTSSGTYTDILVGSNLADSVIMTTLTVVQTNELILQNGLTLFAADSTMGTFQWVNCALGNQPIPGATNASLAITQNGSYALLTTNGTCQVLSNCIEINGLSLDETKTSVLNIFPNPTIDALTIEVDASVLGASYHILDEVGRVVLSGRIDTIESTLSTAHLAEGIYTFMLDGKEENSLKWVKL